MAKNAAEAQQREEAAARGRQKAHARQLQKEVHKAHGLRARMRGRRTHRGSPELVSWLDLLALSLSQRGYVKQKVTWGEKFRGVRIVVSAAFDAGGTSYMICVLETPKDAATYARVFLADPVSVKSQREGWLQVTTLDRRVFVAFNAKGLRPGDFGRWTQVAGHALPVT